MNDTERFIVDFRCYKELSKQLIDFILNNEMGGSFTEEKQKELGTILRQIRYCAGEMLSDVDEAAYIYSDDEESTDRQYNQFKETVTAQWV